MPAPTPRTAAEKLRMHASELLYLADQYDIPSRSMNRVEKLVGQVEQVAADVRAVARGRQ